LSERAETTTLSASKAITHSLRELQEATQAVVDQSKQTASSVVSEILETQNMLRADTNALFERLREANILLQEVLSGAHENMSGIEGTLVARVADFVSAMNDVVEKTGVANGEVERSITSFQTVTGKTVNDLIQLAAQFDAHGRALAEAAALVESSNQRAESTVAERRAVPEELGGSLDAKGNDL